MELNMKSDKSIAGTSLRGKLDCDYLTLTKVFGNPSIIEGGCKTDVEWKGEIDGDIFTIYNWKDGKSYCGDEGLEVEQITDWHIGGLNSDIVEKLQSLVII